MSYRSGGYKSPFVGVGVVIGVLAAIFFGIRGLSILGNLTGIGVPTPQSVEKQLFSNAGTGDLYRAYKRDYPQDYAKLNADVLRHLEAGESTPQIDAVIGADLLESARLHRKDAMQAPDAVFAAYRRSEIKVVEILRSTDPQLCATYVMTGEVNSPELRAFQGPLVAFRIAALDAGAAGRDHPANRVVAAPTREVVQQLGRQMIANGASQAMVVAFFNGTMTQLAPMEKCLVGLSFYRAVDQMPAGKGEEIYAFLLSHNA
jgi:hypothetical protein